MLPFPSLHEPSPNGKQRDGKTLVLSDPDRSPSSIDQVFLHFSGELNFHYLRKYCFNKSIHYYSQFSWIELLRLTLHITLFMMVSMMGA